MRDIAFRRTENSTFETATLSPGDALESTDNPIDEADSPIVLRDRKVGQFSFVQLKGKASEFIAAATIYLSETLKSPTPNLE